MRAFPTTGSRRLRILQDRMKLAPFKNSSYAFRRRNAQAGETSVAQRVTEPVEASVRVGADRANVLGVYGLEHDCSPNVVGCLVGCRR